MGAAGRGFKGRGGAGVWERGFKEGKAEQARRGGVQSVETGLLEGRLRGVARTRGVASGTEREGRERLGKLAEQREATAKLAA